MDVGHREFPRRALWNEVFIRRVFETTLDIGANLTDRRLCFRQAAPETSEVESTGCPRVPPLFPGRWPVGVVAVSAMTALYRPSIQHGNAIWVGDFSAQRL
jgi:hypothetical protein